ncbi:DMT family transporter [Limosilactobacillus ingluviei]|uniref:DMT family transporter n=1 Tax=Limosilactobacillus ingluviei TaxID=148604 RepID=UPI0019571280|nr:DMT family transporter [Limosilactobacillus ingluviei]MBM6728277.1 DMT family transporter [Limosilactobacillus ingluviei]
MNNNQVIKGMTWAGFASLSWGISGTVLQLISQDLAVPGPWMFSTRTTVTGVILLLLSAVIYRGQIFNVFKTKAALLSVVTYGLFGLAANLITFYYSIQTGNASTATILQYLSPLFIVLGGIFFYRNRPLRSDLLAFAVALVGVLLCITRGDLTHLAVPLVSLLWGLGSGITAAFYVVLPQKASATNPPLVVLGWGTMIAGLFFNLLHPFWVGVPPLTPTLVSSVATVIFFGTILPFGMLLYASRLAPSDVVSIIDALQPIMTTILSVIFFHLAINFFEVLGIVLVLIAIYILQNGRRKAQ